MSDKEESQEEKEPDAQQALVSQFSEIGSYLRPPWLEFVLGDLLSKSRPTDINKLLEIGRLTVTGNQEIRLRQLDLDRQFVDAQKELALQALSRSNEENAHSRRWRYSSILALTVMVLTALCVRPEIAGFLKDFENLIYAASVCGVYSLAHKQGSQKDKALTPPGEKEE